jgi:Flp pilus assembly protein CpaB
VISRRASTPRGDAADVQPHLPDRVATLLGRYRLGGRRTRALRRLVAVALLLTAGALASMPSTSAAAGTAVLIAARDLPAGTRLSGADIAVASVPSPPDGLLPARRPGDVAGAVLSGPMRRGEILTDARVVGDRGPDPGRGRAAVPVPLADPTVAALLAPGMHVVLVEVPGDGWRSARGAGAPVDGGGIEVLAADAVVLSVSEPSGGFGGASAGRVAVVSVPAAEADVVTAAAAAGGVTLRFGS